MDKVTPQAGGGGVPVLPSRAVSAPRARVEAPAGAASLPPRRAAEAPAAAMRRAKTQAIMHMNLTTSFYIE